VFRFLSYVFIIYYFKDLPKTFTIQEHLLQFKVISLFLSNFVAEISLIIFPAFFHCNCSSKRRMQLLQNAMQKTIFNISIKWLNVVAAVHVAADVAFAAAAARVLEATVWLTFF